MRISRVTPWVVVALVCLAQPYAAAQKPQPKTVKRAAPPKFDPSATAPIFFADVFKEGLKGDRPNDLGKSPSKVAGTPSGTVPSAGPGDPVEGTGGVFAWSKIISPTVVEDEIKARKLEVDKDVSTPTDFAGKGYKLARRNFTVLAVMFGIAGEYDGEVRWKKDAPAARDLFARTAANAKVGTEQVYKEAKLRKQELQDLVGGAGAGGKGGEAKADWKAVAGRSPVMQRLEIAHQGNLQPWTANKGEFTANKDKVKHEAQIIAALAEVLTKGGMEDTDNNEYQNFALLMKQGAREIVEAVELNNYDNARKAVGDIGKACSKCHEVFRG